MHKQENTDVAFFALLQAGLWESKVQMLSHGEIDFEAVLELAENQSVVGLIAAGIEHITDKRLEKKDVLKFIGRTVHLERQNQAMNYFIGVLVEKMRAAGIYTLLVKGQEVAQCYERPLWRSCGDIDFFLSEENYEKAKDFLTPLAVSVSGEYVREKHLGMTIDSWVVELHGHLYCGLSSRIDRELDAVLDDTFHFGNVRVWINNDVPVFQLSVENEAFYVFTHILQHFYKGGIGLRQICDWCRLLWKYGDEIDTVLLEQRLRRAGLITEWKAFGVFAMEYLGMPVEAIPLIDSSNVQELKKLLRKARRIRDFILMAGNFGHNRDHSYFAKYAFLIRKCISFGRRVGDLFLHAMIFPIDSLRFFPALVINGVKSVARGEG